MVAISNDLLYGNCGDVCDLLPIPLTQKYTKLGDKRKWHLKNQKN
jgi:hypothetical protein